MLEQPMINKMLAMRLHGMAEALKAQEQDANARELSFLVLLCYKLLTRMEISAAGCIVKLG